MTLAGSAGVDPTLFEATIPGSLYESTWSIAGNVTRITSSSAADWDLDVHSAVGSLNLGTVSNANIAVDGPVTTLKVINWTDVGSFAAERVKYFRVLGSTKFGILGDCTADVTLTGNGVDPTLTSAIIKGALHDATWNVAGLVKNLDVAYWIADANLYFDGNVNTITTGGLARSRIFLGVLDTVEDMPDATDDFGPAYTLGSFVIDGISTAMRTYYLGELIGLTGDLFQDSCIAAWNLGAVRLREIASDNTDPYSADGKDPVFTQFGVTYAGQTPNITWRQDGHTFTWPTNWPPNTNDFQVLEV